MRWFFFFILCTIFSFAYSSNANPHLGAVFIHGTNDHRADADGDYWKPDYIKSITNGLADPQNYLLVKCDFSQYMWHEDSAGCVADQINAFIAQKHLTHIIVYSHSNGANVMRWILSNPTYDPRYMALVPKIIRIIAIAPSSGGTPLADQGISGGFFSESLAWLLGYQTNAVKQQRIGDMALFNDTLLNGTPGRPSLIKPFLAIVGTDVDASPFSSTSYCNGFWLNSALKLTQLYLDKCADGFLTCKSQSLAGKVWFYDKDKTSHKHPLSHNQSRHSCFGLAKLLREDLISGAQS